jgi:hypothetical protein
VVHGCATLAILLIIQVQPGGIGLAKGFQRRRVRKDVSVSEKADVLASKLYTLLFSVRGGHCVFAWMEEEEKSNRDCNGPCHEGLLIVVKVNGTLYDPHWQCQLRFRCWVVKFVAA